MKKIYTILTCCLSLFLLPVFTGCVEEVELVETLNLPACLTPSTTSASIDRTDGKTVTFTWANAKGATQYVIEIYQSDNEEALPEEVFADEANRIPDEIVSPEELIVPASESGSTTTKKLTLQMDKFYFARVKAQGLTAEGTKAIDDSKWAVFPYPIATYDVKPAVSNVTVTARTPNSVTVSWTMPENDVEVDRIRVTPSPIEGDTKAYYDYVFPEGTEVTEAMSFTAGTAEAPLQSSTLYNFAVHYGSANRGEVVAWTRPDWSDAVEVSTAEELKNAIAEAAAVDPSVTEVEPRQIKLVNMETPYETGEVEVNGPVVIFGDQSESGESPLIIGKFNLKPSSETTLGASHIRLEALDLQGTGSCSDCISIAAAFPDEEKVTVEVINCNLTGYAKSALYCTKDNSIIFEKILYDGCTFDDMSTGQHTFDIRGSKSIESMTVRNSTFSNIGRSMFRVDNGDLNFDFANNTVYKAGNPGDSNANGIFHFQAEVGTFKITENLFMSIDLAIVSAKTDASPSVSKNFFYKIGETAWAPEGSGESQVNKDGTGSLAQSAAIAGGGAVLTSDPCENAERGLFNIKPESALILDAGAGDPRWLVEYVPETPDPLTPVEYDHAWDLTDVAVFYDEIEESTVRGNLEFFVTDNPIRVTDDGMEFTAEATLSASNVPTDCAIAFLVDKPGSVVISTTQSRSGSVNDHITVACGPADGSSASVEGAITVEAKGGRVAFPDIEGQTLIYLYGCGPIVLTDLMWIEDVTTVGPQILDTPADVALSASSATAGDGPVSLTWSEVSGAASYTVTVTGPAAATVTPYEGIAATSFELPLSDMATGVYRLTVQAVAADASKENSELSDPVTFEKTETQTVVSSTVPTSWGSADFQHLSDVAGMAETGAKLSRDYIYNNLKVRVNKNDKASFVNEKNTLGADAYAFSTGGGGNADQLALQIMVPGPGTLTYEAISGGSGERPVAIYIGGVEYTSGPGYKTDVSKAGKNGYPAPPKGTTDAAMTIRTFDLTGESIASGTVISLTSDEGGINFFSVTWTPAGYDPDAEIPSEPTAIEVQTDIMAAFTAAEDYSIAEKGDANGGKTATVLVNSDDEVLFVSKGGSDPKDIVWDASDRRIKLQGSSPVDAATGLPTGNYISFKITKPGIVKHYIRSGSSSDDERKVKIDILKNVSEIVNVYDAFAPTPGYGAGKETLTEITKEHLIGAQSAVTVYIYAPSNSVNIYYLEYIPAE